MQAVFIAIEGFNLKQGYVIKELSIVHPDDTFQHYQFKTPDNFTPSAAARKTVKFTKKYLNGFSLEEQCFLPNHIHSTILYEFKNFKIYVAGEITKRFLFNTLPETNIIDVCSLLDFQYPEVLPDPHCFRAHRHRYCSLAKSRYIKAVLDAFCCKEDAILY